nr:uncharacterized protein LOC129444502 isoform X1 [Misgurnus anguillicaudatus]
MADQMHYFKSNLRRKAVKSVSNLLQGIENESQLVDDDLIDDHTVHDLDVVVNCDDSDDLMRDWNLDSDRDDSEGPSEHRPDLADDLVNWALEFNITMVALSALLSILHFHHPNLPRDGRTLLKTVTNYKILAVAGGAFFYFGVLNAITGLLENVWMKLPSKHCLQLQLNFDGLPLFKSNNQQLWPILGLLKEAGKCPFMIGIFGGDCKPKSLNEYLRDLVSELSSLQSGFWFKGKLFFLRVCSVVCDAPARAFVKGIKSHSGYSACDKCVQTGVFIGNRMTFPQTDSALRTDASFRQMLDEDHHVALSPLTGLGFDMVLDFPHDYMHLVCLGVVRRLFDLWCSGPLPTRLSGQLVKALSQNLQQLKNNIPCEFARKPRAFEERGRWKATELRQFLLYTGPVVLVDVLAAPVYHNFMLLSVAIFMLANPKVDVEICDCAKTLLVSFVEHFGRLYGEGFLVYNLHGLVHLSDDVKRHGCIDGISGFPFENFLGEVKRMVRGPNFPVAQIVRRLSERTNNKRVEKVKAGTVLRKEHVGGPLPQGVTGGIQEFKELHTDQFCVKITEGITVLK